MVMIAIWAVVSIYWGSVWKEIDLSPNLNGWIVNRDSGIVGSTVQQALLAPTPRQAAQHLDGHRSRSFPHSGSDRLRGDQPLFPSGSSSL